MAELGFRTINDMIGRTECITMRPGIEQWKARGLDSQTSFMDQQCLTRLGVTVRSSRNTRLRNLWTDRAARTL